MGGYQKYAATAALGILMVVVGSLVVAGVTSDDADNSFGSIFAGIIGVSLIVVGIGTTIASAATYLARR